MNSLKEISSPIRLFLSLKKSELSQNTQDKVHRTLLNIAKEKGREAREQMADKLAIIIENGVSETELIKILNSIEN